MEFSMEKLASMNFDYFDVGIISIVLILSIKGFIQGFVKELFGLIGLVLGLFLGLKYSDEVAKLISENLTMLNDKSLLSMLGFLSILIVVWIFFTLLGAIISKLATISGLGFFNRLLGFIVGGGKYFIIFSLIITAFSSSKFVRDNIKSYTSKSFVYPYLIETGTYFLSISTSSISTFLKDSKKDIKTK